MSIHFILSQQHQQLHYHHQLVKLHQLNRKNSAINWTRMSDTERSGCLTSHTHPAQLCTHARTPTHTSFSVIFQANLSQLVATLIPKGNQCNIFIWLDALRDANQGINHETSFFLHPMIDSRMLRHCCLWWWFSLNIQEFQSDILTQFQVWLCKSGWRSKSDDKSNQTSSSHNRQLTQAQYMTN